MGGKEGSPAMTTFGPFYPTTLQGAINHAERLVDALSVQQECAAGGEIWLVGRSDEIQCFVREVAEDWRRGRLDERGAARSIDGYLTDLHVSLGQLFAGNLPRCCRGAAAMTALPAALEASTRVLPILAVQQGAARRRTHADGA